MFKTLFKCTALVPTDVNFIAFRGTQLNYICKAKLKVQTNTMCTGTGKLLISLFFVLFFNSTLLLDYIVQDLNN
jgi:hypothetical protein